jgi:hypothetical protein
LIRRLRAGLARFGQGPWLALIATAAIFALSRAYQGVRHDSRLYVGDALARLDPGGVGRDLMFVHDGQFGFSLYTPLLARLIGAFGLANASLMAVVTALALWFVGLVLLTRALTTDRTPATRWAVLVFVVALPAFYGPLNVISFGEPFATPRGLAEAAGLAGMAAYLSGRKITALALFVAGMLFHPIMGLCGLAAVYMALSLEDRRWLIPGGVVAAMLLAAAVLGLPIAERLLTVMDPQWRGLVEARSPILFPSLWPLQSWNRLAVQVATLAIGASLLHGRARTLALGALAAGLIGLVALAVLGDRFSLLLILQVQPWRMLEPVALLAAASLALCVLDLPRRGPGALLALAALIIGWLFMSRGVTGLCASAAALALVWLDRRMRWSAPARVRFVALAVLGLAVAVYAVAQGVALASAQAVLPPTWPFSLGLVWNSGLPGLAAVLVVGIWATKGWAAPRPGLLLGATVLLVGLVVGLWDDRSSYVRFRDQGADSALRAMIASRPGDVLWLAGDMEPWVLAGRPSWASKMQGAGVVFSRPLAVSLQARVSRLSRAGLVGRDWLEPLTADGSGSTFPKLAQLVDLCLSADAPAWIVAPVTDDAGLDPALQAEIWSPPTPYALELVGRGRIDWLTASRYAVIPCAGRRWAVLDAVPDPNV